MIRTLPAHAHDHAVTALREDGVVILRDAVDRAHITALRVRMLADLPRVLARRDAPFNFNRTNVQQSPSRARDLIFTDVLCNEHVIAVTSRLLPKVQNTFYSGNTALPGEERQPVHGDTGHLWVDHLAPPHGIVINIPLVDVGPHNGATELWPGTHAIPYALYGSDLRVPEALLAERRLVRPPIQPEMTVGSVLLRDLRLWHAGMPNHTADPRPMLAMIHNPGWWPVPDPPLFQADTRDRLRHPILTTTARWVEHVDHTALDHRYAVEPDAPEAVATP